MFKAIRNAAVSLALTGIREKIVNANIEGIGVVREISFKDGKVHLALVLNGLEDREIGITCASVAIAPDGSSVTLGDFDSNMPFAKNALDRFASRKIDVPPGAARTALLLAKKALGLG